MQAAKEASTTRGTWHKPELDEELVLVLDPVEELELEPVLVLVDVALEVAVAVAARVHTHTLLNHSLTPIAPHQTSHSGATLDNTWTRCSGSREQSKGPGCTLVHCTHQLHWKC